MRGFRCALPHCETWGPTPVSRWPTSTCFPRRQRRSDGCERDRCRGPSAPRAQGLLLCLQAHHRVQRRGPGQSASPAPKSSEDIGSTSTKILRGYWRQRKGTHHKASLQGRSSWDLGRRRSFVVALAAAPAGWVGERPDNGRREHRRGGGAWQPTGGSCMRGTSAPG